MFRSYSEALREVGVNVGPHPKVKGVEDPEKFKLLYQ